ncbi:MAG: hypothetical protein Q3994_01295 [Prevotella sp.]|nr:hypothetical protein [Prevotella sp.]
MFYNLSQRGLAIAYLELGAMREPAREISEMLEPTSFHLFFVNHCWLVLYESICAGFINMHIGEQIHNVMMEQGRTTVWLARELGCARTVIYRIYERPSIDTELLLQISKLLNHNFFVYYDNRFATDV